MAATTEGAVTIALRNIEIGPATEQLRADPTPTDPGRRSTATSRDYRITFSADSPGISATFVVHIGWDGRHSTNCPVEELEAVGQTLVREFASRIAQGSM